MRMDVGLAKRKRERQELAAATTCLRQSPVSLSKTEFKVLYALATTPGSALAPAAIRNASGAASGLDVTVHRLRRKLARAPEGGNLIQTVRGKGYMLVPPGA